jgi:DNA mismatch repair protein MutS
VSESGAAVTPLARSAFDSDGGERRLTALYGVARSTGSAASRRAELSALGALDADYLALTQKGRLAASCARPARKRTARACRSTPQRGGTWN